MDDVTALYNGGKINWHEDSTRLNQVLSLRSFPHIRRVFTELARKTGKEVKDLVEEQYSSGTEDGYVACGQYSLMTHLLIIYTVEPIS
jgi:Annexin